MKGRDVKMSLKLIKPEHKETLDAALDAALQVMMGEKSMAEEREKRVQEAMKASPNVPEEEVRKIQDVAVLHSLVAALIERASEHSEDLVMVLLESISKINMLITLKLMAKDILPVDEHKQVAKPEDIPTHLPANLRKMKES